MYVAARQTGSGGAPEGPKKRHEIRTGKPKPDSRLTPPRLHPNLAADKIVFTFFRNSLAQSGLRNKMMGEEEQKMSCLGIEFISVFGMPPVQLIELAAELGCQHITTAPQPIDYNPEHFSKFNFVEDAALRRETKAALKANDISISLGEGLVVLPNLDTQTAYAAALDAFAEIGIPRLNLCAMEPDRARAFDEMAKLAEMAAARGMVCVVEYAPVFAAKDLAAGLAALRHIGRDDCKILVDTMHAGRTGTSLAELSAIGDKIGYIQLCDAPRVPVIPNYIEEAMFQRRVPGGGEMPLLALLTALPRNLVIGLEVPLRDQAEAGVTAKDRMRRCVAAARALLAQLPA